MNEKPEVEIGAEGIDVEALVAELQARVEEKRRAGAWDDPRIARAEKNNILNLKDDDDFIDNYLECLRRIITVDINAFDIREKRAHFSWFLVRFKKAVWSLLRFYTYRLWSQQNESNAMLFSAIELLSRRSDTRIKNLEKQVAALEAKLAAANTPPAP